MAFDEMAGNYMIEGEGTTTDYSIVRTEMEGHEVFITTSTAKGADGSEITVSTWWDHGTAIVSTVLIDDERRLH